MKKTMKKRTRGVVQKEKSERGEREKREKAGREENRLINATRRRN